jgi:hypothetical protein
MEKANEFVSNFHRQHYPANRAKYAIAVIDSSGLVHGVAIVGNPVARAFDDGVSLEVLRCCTDGTANACSALYGAAWRSAKGMGARSMYTYTLGEDYNETGGSLRGAGWLPTLGAGGAPWNHATRSTVRGYDRIMPGIEKVRWEIHATEFFPIERVSWPYLTNGLVTPSETLWGDPIIEGEGAHIKEKKTERAKVRNRDKV